MRTDAELVEIWRDTKQGQHAMTQEERDRLHALPEFREGMTAARPASLQESASCPASNRSATYTVRGIWSIIMDDLPPVENIWNGVALVPGAVVEVIGQPGLGKSRIVFDLARHQVLGEDFGGRKTLGRPLRWLFAGSENGITRLDRESKAFVLHLKPEEVRGMSETERLELAAANGFTEDRLKALDENVRTFTLENPEDFDISLLNEDNRRKLTATLAEHRPDVLVVDPWGDVIAGKELDDGDVRDTVRILRGCLAGAELKKTVIFIVNHARMGAAEEAKARGSDEGNFGKNSKCLFSISRQVFNLRRASFDDNPDVEIINAKNNDGKKTPPLALRLDPNRMSYDLIEGFDHDEWQMTLDEAAKENGRSRTKKDTSPNAMLEAALRIVTAAGSDKMLAVANFTEKMKSEGFGPSAIRSFLKARRGDHPEDAKIVFQRQLRRVGERVVEVPKCKNGCDYVTTPELRNAYLRGWGCLPALDVSC